MKVSTKSAAAAALVIGALGGALAVAPTYAQTATTEPTIETAQVPGRMGMDLPFAGPAEDVMRIIAHAEALLEQFDTNGDGTVTQEEIDAVRAAELAEYDADGDGALTLAEYQAYWLAKLYERMVDAFQHLDANGDGLVTAEEFNAGLANIVARLDQNGDGALGADDRPERPAVDTRRGAIIIGPQGAFGFGVGPR